VTDDGHVLKKRFENEIRYTHMGIF